MVPHVGEGVLEQRQVQRLDAVPVLQVAGAVFGRGDGDDGDAGGVSRSSIEGCYRARRRD